MNVAVEMYNNLLIAEAQQGLPPFVNQSIMDIEMIGYAGSEPGDAGDAGEYDNDIQIGVVEYVNEAGVPAGGANCWLSETDNGDEVLVLESGTNDADGVVRNFWQMRVSLGETISSTLKGVAAHIYRDQVPGHYVSIVGFDYFEGESLEPLYATINQRMDLPELTWNHLRNAEYGNFKLAFRMG